MDILTAFHTTKASNGHLGAVVVNRYIQKE